MRGARWGASLGLAVLGVILVLSPAFGDATAPLHPAAHPVRFAPGSIGPSVHGPNTAVATVQAAPPRGVVNLTATPEGAMYDPVNGYTYVLEPFPRGSSAYPGSAIVMNGSTIVANVSVGSYPVSEAYDPTDGWVYVVNEIGDSVTIINGTAVQATVSIAGYNPLPIAYDSQDREMYVADENGAAASINVLNGSRLATNLSLPMPGGADIRGIAYDPLDGTIYAVGLAYAASNDYAVGEIRGSQVVAMVNISSYGYPTSISVDPANGYVEVGLSCPIGALGVVLSGSRVIGTPRVGSTAWCATPGTYDSSDGDLYLPNSAVTFGPPTSDGMVEVINGTAAVAEIPVGPGPVAPTIDPASGAVYVPNSGSDYLSVIVGTRTVGSISVGNGPVDATLDNLTGQIYVPNSGSENVTIVPAWTSVTVHETGLPVGTTWWLNLTRAPALVSKTQTSNSTDLPLAWPAGSYSYTLGTNDKSYAATGGWLNVSSSSNTLNVSFFPELENLTFTEIGLPAGTNWTVRLGGIVDSSTDSTLVFTVSNGSYRYTVDGVAGWTTSSYAGTVRVQGPSQAEIDWTEVTYPVRFNAHGLPNGTGWAVLIGSASNSAVGSSITLWEPNGTFAYVIPGVNGYVSNGSGSVRVNGSGVNVNVTFSPQTYPVVFIEFGLPAGTNWSVSVTNTSHGFNQTRSSTGSSILFFLPNGTYTVTYHLPSPYSNGSTSSQITVAGRSLDVPSLNLVPPLGPSHGPPPPPLQPWVAVVIAALVGPLVAGIVYRDRRRRRSREFVSALFSSEWEVSPEGVLRQRPPGG